MDMENLKALLNDLKMGSIGIDECAEKLRDLPYKDLGYAMIDNHRELRVGYPEVIYCAGKTIEQVVGIIEFMQTKDNNILATRATREIYDAVKKSCPEAEYHSDARIISIREKDMIQPSTYICVITSGTSDIPVAEEAAVTAEVFGNRVERIYDVDVAGIHRVFDKLDVIRGARVIVIAAGMEGALASVIGGLVDKPVIAVPTSVGYGASFGGLSALLSMLNSCASGVSVVNIDNGFGAGYLASMMNKM